MVAGDDDPIRHDAVEEPPLDEAGVEGAAPDMRLIAGGATDANAESGAEDPAATSAEG